MKRPAIRFIEGNGCIGIFPRQKRTIVLNGQSYFLHWPRMLFFVRARRVLSLKYGIAWKVKVFGVLGIYKRKLFFFNLPNMGGSWGKVCLGQSVIAKSKKELLEKAIGVFWDTNFTESQDANTGYQFRQWVQVSRNPNWVPTLNDLSFFDAVRLSKIQFAELD